MRNLDWDDDFSDQHSTCGSGPAYPRGRHYSDVTGGRHQSDVTGRHLSDFTIQLAKADEEHFHIDDRVELSDCIRLKREMMETLNDYKREKQALQSLNVRNETE